MTTIRSKIEHQQECNELIPRIEASRKEIQALSKVAEETFKNASLENEGSILDPLHKLKNRVDILFDGLENDGEMVIKPLVDRVKSDSERMFSSKALLIIGAIAVASVALLALGIILLSLLDPTGLSIALGIPLVTISAVSFVIDGLFYLIGNTYENRRMDKLIAEHQEIEAELKKLKEIYVKHSGSFEKAKEEFTAGLAKQTEILNCLQNETTAKVEHAVQLISGTRINYLTEKFSTKMTLLDFEKESVELQKKLQLNLSQSADSKTDQEALTQLEAKIKLTKTKLSTAESLATQAESQIEKLRSDLKRQIDEATTQKANFERALKGLEQLKALCEQPS